MVVIGDLNVKVEVMEISGVNKNDGNLLNLFKE